MNAANQGPGEVAHFVGGLCLTVEKTTQLHQLFGL